MSLNVDAANVKMLPMINSNEKGNVFELEERIVVDF